ncbi:hypothetical protein GF406_02250 [candidate division KSB1 bacterium]|jgi:hypothetical protein|nr:hypothetical protein [candidate division KSB1 bacterium]
MKFRMLVLLLLIAMTPQVWANDWQEFMIQTPQTEMPVADVKEEKSVAKGVLFSALVPGAGQAYSGSWLKAAAFVAVEAAGIALAMNYDQEGQDIEQEFRAFADENWIESDYWGWIARHAGLEYNSSNLDPLREWEHDHPALSHALPHTKTQQYYEMIGKYDQFNYGWVDSEIGSIDNGWNVSKRSSKRLYYEDRRDASNQAYKRATTFVTVTLLNHLISAFDAGFSISRHNRQVNAAFYMKPLQMNQQTYAALSMQVEW